MNELITFSKEQNELLKRIYSDVSFFDATLSKRYQRILTQYAQKAYDNELITIERGSEYHRILRQIRRWYVEHLQTEINY